jgi:hypothetical protein
MTICGPNPFSENRIRTYVMNMIARTRVGGFSLAVVERITISGMVLAMSS